MNVQEILSVLSEEGFVHQTGGEWQWTQESYPADAVSLRSVTSDNFVIVDITGDERVIGETDFTSGPSTLHEKAIYIVEGKQFQVERLDVEGRKAFVRQVECDYYTDAITYTKVTMLDTFASSGQRWRRARAGLRLGRARDDVTEHHRSRLTGGPGRLRRAPPGRTAKSTSCRAWSDSRRSSSTRTRTSAPANSTCPNSRCTRPRIG